MVGKNRIYLERNIPQKERGPSRVALKCGVVSFYGLGNFIA